MLIKNNKENEKLALAILKQYSCRYSALILRERPDLQDIDNSFGVEVSSNRPEEIWRGLAKGERILNNSFNFKIVPYTIKETLDIIDAKSKKSYPGFFHIELFIYVDEIEYYDDHIKAIISDCSNRIEFKYQRLFLFSLATNVLWDCDIKSTSFSQKRFSSEEWDIIKRLSEN